MPIRSLTPELQKIAEHDLNEAPNRIEEDLQHIREWLKKQPHLKVRTDDQWLLSFLRGCKFSLQRTKEKLDFFYTMRALVPEFFTDRDPFAPDVQAFLRAGALIPLPVNDPTAPRVFLYRWAVMDPSTMPLTSLMKVYFMIMDILMMEDDSFVILGITTWAEYKNFPLNYVLQYTPSFLKKAVLCIQNAYPLRLKSVHCTNGPAVFETIFNLCKSFMNEKLKERMYLYSEDNFEKFYKHIPKAVLPKDFGGDNESIDVLAAHWKKKIESYRDWFLEDAKYFSREELRNGTPKTTADIFGVEGTFRKLQID